ncbi:MAG: hypothetical protein RLZZ200_2399, partial [Pseudomonadota bacterium]
MAADSNMHPVAPDPTEFKSLPQYTVDTLPANSIAGALAIITDHSGVSDLFDRRGDEHDPRAVIGLHRPLKGVGIMKRWLLSLCMILTAVPLAAQSVNKTLSGTTCPGNGCLTVDVAGSGTLGLQVEGVFSGTLTFTQAVGDNTYVAWSVVPNGSGSSVTSTTTTGLFFGSVAGANRVRIAFTAYTSGTAIVSTVRAQAKLFPAAAAPGSAGADTQVVFNQGGVFGSSSNFVYDYAVTGGVTISGGAQPFLALRTAASAPANSGIMRLSYGVGVNARNRTNNGDIGMFGVGQIADDDYIEFGDNQQHGVSKPLGIKFYPGSSTPLRIDVTGVTQLPGTVITAGAGMAVANVGANSCGTTAATIAGNNNVGEVTVGATAGTQCRITLTVAA